MDQVCNCMQQTVLEKAIIGIRLVTSSISLQDYIFTLMKERRVGVSAAWHFHVPCCLTGKETE